MTRRTPHALAVSAFVLASTLAAAAPPETDARLHELGQTLKAAVASGSMSGDEAMKLWEVLSERIRGREDAAKDDDSKEKEKEKAKAKADDEVGASFWLNPLRPGDVRTLFRPEFTLRDVARLDAALNFDDAFAPVIEVLWLDYLEAFDLATQPLREALAQFERGEEDRWIAATLAKINAPEVEVAVDRTQAAVRKWNDDAATKVRSKDTPEAARRRAEIEAKRQAWADELIAVSAVMQERLDALRRQARADLDDLAAKGADVTTDDLVRLAHELRGTRRQLRADLETSLAAIVVAPGRTDRHEFDAAMTALRHDRLLPHGVLSGESLALRTALAESVPPDHPAHDLAPTLPDLTARLEARTEAVIDREIAGLVALDDAPSNRPAFEQALQSELAIRVEIRDLLVHALFDTRDQLAADDASVAALDDAIARAFPTVGRRRWAEDALEAAAVAAPDGAAGDAVAALVDEIIPPLEAQRRAAILDRMVWQERVWRAMHDPSLGDDPKKSLWTDAEDHAFAAVDDHVETSLRDLLTDAQFEALPPRSRRRK